MGGFNWQRPSCPSGSGQRLRAAAAAVLTGWHLLAREPISIVDDGTENQIIIESHTISEATLHSADAFQGLETYL